MCTKRFCTARLHGYRMDAASACKKPAALDQGVAQRGVQTMGLWVDEVGLLFRFIHNHNHTHHESHIRIVVNRRDINMCVSRNPKLSSTKGPVLRGMNTTQ